MFHPSKTHYLGWFHNEQKGLKSKGPTWAWWWVLIKYLEVILINVLNAFWESRYSAVFFPRCLGVHCSCKVKVHPLWPPITIRATVLLKPTQGKISPGSAAPCSLQYDSTVFCFSNTTTLLVVCTNPPTYTNCIIQKSQTSNEAYYTQDQNFPSCVIWRKKDEGMYGWSTTLAALQPSRSISRQVMLANDLCL